MLTTKNIIEELSFYGKFLLRFRWIILGVFLLGVVFSVYQQKKREPSFVAEKTFMVADDDGGAGIGTILGQFGFGGSVGGQSNYEKIRQIGLSDLILSRTLLDTASLSGKNDLIINHIINVFGLRENWESQEYKKYAFIASNELDLTGKSILKNIGNMLKGDLSVPNTEGVITITPDIESNILKIEASTEDPELSILLTEKLYNQLSDFYIKKSIESNAKTYKTLTEKADSVANLLSGSESRLAKSSDFARGLVLNRDRMEYARSTRDIELFGAMYGEVLKNKETAEFMLNSKTPYFQEIDSPYLPLYDQNKFSIIDTLLFGIVMLIFTTLLVVVYAYYQKEVKPHFS